MRRRFGVGRKPPACPAARRAEFGDVLRLDERDEAVKLSILVLTLDGRIPESLTRAAEGRAEVEVVVVTGVSPVGKARNRALALARGEYVAWVDADDEVAEDWLPSILKALETKPDVVDFDASVEWTDRARRVGVLGGRYADGPIDARRYARDVCEQNVGGQLWSKVFRRSLFAGRSFVGCHLEDYRMIVSLLPDVRSVVHVARPLYVYRRSGAGLSQHVTGGADVLALVRQAENDRRLAKGVMRIAIDHVRHVRAVPAEVKHFVRRNLWRFLLAAEVRWAERAKALLAAF